jgi:putative ABC transport system permease protein
LQFLIEAICLSMAGGAIGIVLGTIVAKMVASRFELPFVPRVDMGLLAFGFSLLVGVAFGLYPARKAARLDPIEALRYE